MSFSSCIALLTDFGESDGYVAAMKGTILSICHPARIVDITHQVAPQNVEQAAYLLWSVYKFFPRGTIFVAVVDPGVGTARRILLLRSTAYCFLAPDNGLLKYIVPDLKDSRTYHIQNKRYFRKTISATFHGRDIFAPAAAHLARGSTPSSFGPIVKSPLHSESFLRLENGPTPHHQNAKVLHIDHFGNIVLNVSVADPHVLTAFTLAISNRAVRTHALTYANAPPRTPFMLVGSSGLLEIALRNGNAATQLGVSLGQNIVIRRTK